jgi:hypothetical protein
MQLTLFDLKRGSSMQNSGSPTNIHNMKLAWQMAVQRKQPPPAPNKKKNNNA